MGWTSTADPLENVARASLFFYTKEQAIEFWCAMLSVLSATGCARGVVPLHTG